MSRPLGIEFAGATYHLTSRGDRREFIFEEDADAEFFVNVVAQGLERYDAGLLAYCLMSNHSLASYLKELGIVEYRVNTAEFTSGTAVAKPGDKHSATASERMKRAHQAAAHDTWFREQVQPDWALLPFRQTSQLSDGSWRTWPS